MISLKLLAVVMIIGAVGTLALQASPQSGLTWVTSWAASAHGPYPSGNPSAQPNLSFAFPTPATGARDQTFRLIVKPDVWGPETRIRLTNAFGTRPVTFGQVHVGLQMSGAAVVPGSNQAVTFRGASTVTVAPGTTVWSDAVRLGFVGAARLGDLDGRKLAVSLHIVGESGPMTWHAKALTTSYLTRPGAGARGDDTAESAFPFTTTSWFFVDAVDMRMPAGTKLVVALGDSITDGTGTTLNGDDRWTDGLSRRLHREFGQRVAIVNAGIGGNQVTGPADYSPEKPVPGGPSALSRLDRDVLSLSGVSTIIWFEGINDLNRNANTPVDTITAAMTEGVRRMRASIPGVRVIGGTVLSALGSTNGAHGSPAQDVERRRLNTFIRTSGLFDAVIDFDAATIDETTGRLRAEFVPDSTTGGPGDSLHPNRAGYLAMAGSIDLGVLGIGK